MSLLQRAGIIGTITLQPKFPLIVEGQKICTYIADFSYYDNESGRLVVEDVKGVKTPTYRIKNKLFHALYKGLRITEIE